MSRKKNLNGFADKALKGAGLVEDRWPADRMGDANEDAPGREDQEAIIKPPTWPDPPRKEAYHGLAGVIVDTIAPHSETDPVGLLLQTMVAFGNVIGRKAHFVAEEDRHFMNLFVVLVGRTSKARKGSSWGRIRRIVEGLDPAWAKERIQSGLSSGEGLTYAVRDPVNKPDKDGNPVQVVEGIEDKRLLDYEAEYAVILKNIERQGNTLSVNLRQAWDTGNLGSLTKNSPTRATDAHVSIIGHCTAEELTRYLSTTEAANGFGNRFLWACVKRSKVLPEGGRMPDGEVKALREDLKKALDFAIGVDLMLRDQHAKAKWHEVYERLSEGQPGMTGSILGRAEAQVMRLACLYALLDRCQKILLKHLDASLALWDYCERSARFVFGESLGDPTADEILQALRASPNGLSREDIRKLFSGNKSSVEIRRALGMLKEHGLAEDRKESSGGRPSERWFAKKTG